MLVSRVIDGVEQELPELPATSSTSSGTRNSIMGQKPTWCNLHDIVAMMAAIKQRSSLMRDLPNWNCVHNKIYPLDRFSHNSGWHNKKSFSYNRKHHKSEKRITIEILECTYSLDEGSKKWFLLSELKFLWWVFFLLSWVKKCHIMLVKFIKRILTSYMKKSCCLLFLILLLMCFLRDDICDDEAIIDTSHVSQ